MPPRSNCSTTIAHELEKVAARMETDAMVVVDHAAEHAGRRRADCGPLAARPRRELAPAGGTRAVTTAIASIGATSLPRRRRAADAEATRRSARCISRRASIARSRIQLERLSRSRIAIVSHHLLVASHARSTAAATFSRDRRAPRTTDGTVNLGRRDVRLSPAGAGRRHELLRARLDRRVLPRGDGRRRSPAWRSSPAAPDCWRSSAVSRWRGS